MSREENRARMPKVTAFIDEVREVFGDCRVTYASENGITKGVKGSEGVQVSEIYVRKANRMAEELERKVA